MDIEKLLRDLLASQEPDELHEVKDVKQLMSELNNGPQQEKNEKPLSNIDKDIARSKNEGGKPPFIIWRHSWSHGGKRGVNYYAGSRHQVGDIAYRKADEPQEIKTKDKPEAKSECTGCRHYPNGSKCVSCTRCPDMPQNATDNYEPKPRAEVRCRGTKQIFSGKPEPLYTVCPGCEDCKLEADESQQEPEEKKDKEWLASMIGEGIPVMLRKALDSTQAMVVHKAIRDLADGEWRVVVTAVANIIWKDLYPVGTPQQESAATLTTRACLPDVIELCRRLPPLDQQVVKESIKGLCGNRIIQRIEQLKAALKKYGKHDKTCNASRIYHVPNCPSCGSTNTRWRRGVGFDHEKMCLDCDSSGFVPEERKGDCSCGLRDIIEATDNL